MSAKEPTLYELARERMIEMQFSGEEMEFIFSDWPEGDEHYQWLLTANREEISEWIMGMSDWLNISIL